MVGANEFAIGSLRISGGTARVNFVASRSWAGWPGDLAPIRFKKAVELTLKQFPSVRRVIVSLNGDKKFADSNGADDELEVKHLPSFTRVLLVEQSAETSANVSIGDLNGDGFVGAPDLAILLGAWAAIALVCLLRLLPGLHHVYALRDRCEPFPADVEARLPLWLDARGTES